MSRSSGRALRFFASTLAVVTAAMAIGYVPTLRLGGADTIVGMFLGGGIAILGSWIGALPVLATQNLTGRGSVNVVLGSAALRLAVVVLLALAAALSGAVPRAALLIWVGICYLLLLVPDSFLAANALKQSHKAHD